MENYAGKGKLLQKSGNYLALFFLFVFTTSSFGQYTFEQISKSDGLPHNNVEAIIEDNQGFMWFGTRNGLARYDGYDMKIYLNTSDHNSISGNWILSVAEDKEGNLWIGTHQDGLNKLDRKKEKFIRFGSDYGIGDQVSRIKVLIDGSIFIGSNNGLAIYNPDNDTFKTYLPSNTPNSINSNLISDILETRDGEIYIASWEDEIMLFDKESEKFTSISYIPEGMPVLNYRKRLLEDSEGNIWISARTHGFCRFEKVSGRSTFYNKENGLNTDVLNGDMILSPEGNIWISSDIGGINVFNPKTESFEYVVHSNDKRGSLPSDHIYTLYLDHSSRVWVGTFDQGVAYYDPLMNKFKNKHIPDNIYSSFNDKSVISLFQDSDETIWIGTDGQGLHAISKDLELESYYFKENNQNSISSNVITCIGENMNGEILIGTYSGGLNVYSKNSGFFKRYLNNPDNPDGIHSENVWTLLVDSEGRQWYGLLGMGADIFNEESGTFTNIGPYSGQEKQISHPNVMALMEDADGDIWFGTEGDGIYVIDKQADKVIRATTNSSSTIMNKGVIKDLFQDSDGFIWISTEGSGLFKYNEGSKEIVQYTRENGLPGMIVQGVREDRTGNIWISTYDGLALLRKNTGEISSFYNYDGLSSNEFNAEAFIRLKNGMLVLGSINGIDIFDPHNISYNQNLPNIVFTKLSILNKEVFPGDTINNKVILSEDITFTKQIKLTQKEKIFSIEFSAINFTHPEKCQYKYILEGFNDEWILIGAEHRYASYSNLKNGKYIFKVQASNNDGKWGNNIEELHIEVLPPFWKTIWFISIMVIIFLGALRIIYINRLRTIENKFKREQALNRTRILELEKVNIESELEKMTYYTINRKKELINYKTRLKALSLKAKESVKQGLHLVMDEIDNEIADDKDWKYIEPRLDKFYNDFISKLRENHPDLSLSEIKVASYVRMNLSSKEIAEFMNKTIRAVENDRYRLRKKINLDSNDSLKSYLLNL